METPSLSATSRRPVCQPTPADADHRYTALGPGDYVRVPGETAGMEAQHEDPPARYAGRIPVSCSTVCNGPLQDGIVVVFMPHVSQTFTVSG